MLVTENLDHFKILRPKLAEEIITINSNWKNKKLDFRFIALTASRSQMAAELIGLAELWQQPRAPLLGQDLSKICYQPTWQDYRLAVISQIKYWNQQIVQPVLPDVLAKLQQAGTIKPIYNLQYFLSLFSKLENHPGKYFFSPADLQDPDFLKVRTLLRQQLLYKFPVDSTSTQELLQTFDQIRLKTQTLLQNLARSPE